ncbi:MAG: hypothetical protein ACPG5Z_00835 [Pseudoalteromonas sp.]
MKTVYGHIAAIELDFEAFLDVDFAKGVADADTRADTVNSKNFNIDTTAGTAVILLIATCKLMIAVLSTRKQRRRLSQDRGAA